jgi:rubrerythrin
MRTSYLRVGGVVGTSCLVREAVPVPPAVAKTPHTVLPKCRTEVGDMFDEDEDEEYHELDADTAGYQEFDVCPYCGILLNELNGQVNCPDCGETF